MKTQKLNIPQMNILVNKVATWAGERRKAAATARETTEKARTDAISEAFTKGKVKLKGYSERDFSFRYNGAGGVYVSFEGKLDREATGKAIVAMFDAQDAASKQRYSHSSRGEVSVSVPWASRYSENIDCDAVDAPIVKQALDLISGVILGADAKGVAEALNKLLKE